MTQKAKVYTEMKAILAKYPGGMRAGDLADKIATKLPDVLLHSIRAQMSDLTKDKDDITKERRNDESGVFYSLAEISPPISDETPDDEISQSERKEDVFYPSFAKYLTYGKDNEDDGERYINECTRAIPIGVARIFNKNKWGTPDVIGIFNPWDNDAVQFPHEIISAEIKTQGCPMEAFGQACAYRLFSHKVYLVLPEDHKDSNRIKALCRIHGIGLVYFDSNVDKITSSIYNTKIPAQRHMPDMNFVNSAIPADVIGDLYGQKNRSK